MQRRKVDLALGACSINQSIPHWNSDLSRRYQSIDRKTSLPEMFSSVSVPFRPQPEREVNPLNKIDFEPYM
jgi:hypothetical protein